MIWLWDLLDYIVPAFKNDELGVVLEFCALVLPARVDVTNTSVPPSLHRTRAPGRASAWPFPCWGSKHNVSMKYYSMWPKTKVLMFLCTCSEW